MNVTTQFGFRKKNNQTKYQNNTIFLGIKIGYAIVSYPI